MLTIFGEYVYEYDIASLVYLFILIWLFYTFKNHPFETNLYFKRLLWCAAITTAADLLACAALEYMEVLPLPLVYIAQMLYYIPNMFCMVFYCLMSLSMTRPYQKYTEIKRRIILVVAGIDTLLVLTSPFTKLLYYIENNECVHGPLMILRYIVAFALIVFILVDVLTYQHLMTAVQRRVSYGYTLACVIGLVIMFVLPNVLALNFAISVALLLAYLALQNPSDIVDPVTKTGSAAEFRQSMETYFRQHNSFSMLCVEYDSLDYYEKVLGNTASQEIAKTLADRLATLVMRAWIYRVARKRFVLVLPHKYDQTQAIIKKILAFGESPLTQNGSNIRLTPAVCLLHAPESISYAEDVDDAIDLAFKEYRKKTGAIDYFSLEEAAIVRKRREQAILRVLNRAINNNEFKVFFQPVFSPQTNSYTYAEALARLSDQTLGDISPAEFIPIAEKNGLVVKIGEIILDRVCSFIHDHLHEGSTLQGISINLSPVQCMQADLADRVLAVAERHGIPPHFIEFELTAETMAHVNDTFTPNMKKLNEVGIRFSIDNYAVNMADAPLFTAMPLTSIKISKNVTDTVVESDRLVPAMRSSIASLKDLGYRVVATGIETAETAEQFKVFGCDYLQGFYYSTPLTAEDFSKLVNE